VIERGDPVARETAELRGTIDAMRTAVQQIRAEARLVPARQLVNLAAVMQAHGAVAMDVSRTEAGEVLAVVVMRKDTPPVFRSSGLTPRQGQVAQLIIEGCANKQIAARRGISIGTVKDHLHAVLLHTGHPTRAALIASAIRSPT
jgi:DNA-binding CsgD family transcriptional regulator